MKEKNFKFQTHMAREVLRSLREGEFRVKKDRVFITQKGELVIIGAVMIKP